MDLAGVSEYALGSHRIQLARLDGVCRQPAAGAGEYHRAKSRKSSVSSGARSELDGISEWYDLHFQSEAGNQFLGRERLQRLPGLAEMSSLYYLSVNDSSWLYGYPNLFNYAPVQFGPATLALMNQTGAVTNPTGQLLQIMENAPGRSTLPARTASSSSCRTPSSGSPEP